ncbi:MAG: glycerol-3-phosphate acyltransferase [Oscillospiraceae bacterium]|nr:glycerol-3-phosphate acyltransferase [Oscillospiraceae bacterium]
MKTFLIYLLFAAAGYLLGCVNTAAILARIKGFDIRGKGSGNAGASNALVTMGKKAAAISALTDILKAFLPVWLLRHVFHLPDELQHAAVLIGVTVILGHMYPFWMQFSGGKGFASLLGMTLALSWKCFLVYILLLAVLLFTTRYIALATIACALATPIWWWFTTHNAIQSLMLSVVCACMIVRHFPNLRRIKNGTEIKFLDKSKKQESV